MSSATPRTAIGSQDIAQTIGDIKVEAFDNLPSEVKVGTCVKLSRHHEQLKHLGVRLVGIGLEKFGVEEFIKGKFWSGELYVDVGKKAYKALNLKAYNAFTGIAGLANSEAIAAHKETKKEGGFGGNFKGDGFQLGATFVFDKGGALRFEHRQQNYGNQPDPKDLVSLCTTAYGTSSSVAAAAAAAPAPETEETAKKQPVCTNEQCSL